MKLFESSTEEFEDSKEITSTRFTFCWSRFQSIVIGCILYIAGSKKRVPPLHNSGIFPRDPYPL